MYPTRDISRYFAIVPTFLVLLALLLVAVFTFQPQSTSTADHDTNNANWVCNIEQDDLRAAILEAFATDPDAVDACQTVADSVHWAEIDLSDRNIRTFEPGPGDLDGFRVNGRLDLRDTSVSVGDLDLSGALSFDTTNDVPVPVGRFTEVASGDDTAGGSFTILLDGRDTGNTGLGILPRSVAEGEILYLTFQFGDRPSGLSAAAENGVTGCNPTNNSCQQASGDYDGGRERGGDSVERFVAFEITVSNQISGSSEDQVVHILTSSRDSSDTLYVVPLLVGDDDRVEDSEDEEIEVTGVQVGQYFNGKLDTAMADATRSFEEDGFDLEYLFNRGAILEDFDDDFEDSLTVALAEIEVTDNDEPRYSVCTRRPQAEEAITDAVGGLPDQRSVNCDDVSLGLLARVPELGIYPDASSGIDEELDGLDYSDLEGLTGLTYLDILGNDIETLPSNVFRDVGTDTAAGVITMIDIRDNPGRRRNTGFLASDVSSSLRTNLQDLQVIRVDYDEDDDDLEGILRDSYTVYESDVLVFDVHVDSDWPVIAFNREDNDDNTITAANRAEADDLPTSPLTLGRDIKGGAGSFVVAVKMPFTGDELRDDEWFNLELRKGNGGPLLDSALVRIRDVTRERTRTISTASSVYSPARNDRPTPRPTPTTSASPRFRHSVTVRGAPIYLEEENNADLKHNIPNLDVVINNRVVEANFANFYEQTGKLERWGWPTSEVLVLEDGTLTQFFQRGVIDFHDVGSGWVLERRLTWDYVGGDASDNDQGVEPRVTNPNAGRLLGPWGHKVSNVSIEGVNVGFADFFERLGGVSAFGLPKTDARVDIGVVGRLHAPGTTFGFTRQYFQAAVFEYHPGDVNQPVKLTLLGDILRNQLVPRHERESGFDAAFPLDAGQRYNAPRVGA